MCFKNHKEPFHLDFHCLQSDVQISLMSEVTLLDPLYVVVIIEIKYCLTLILSESSSGSGTGSRLKMADQITHAR